MCCWLQPSCGPAPTCSHEIPHWNPGPGPPVSSQTDKPKGCRCPSHLGAFENVESSEEAYGLCTPHALHASLVITASSKLCLLLLLPHSDR